MIVETERHSFPLRLTLFYAAALMASPLIVSWFFAGLEGGYMMTGKLAPGFFDLAFKATPVFICSVMLVNYLVLAAFRKMQWKWLVVPILAANAMMILAPVERGICQGIGLCWRQADQQSSV